MAKEIRKLSNYMNIEQIYEAQKKAGVFQLQKMIESGEVWKMEGSYSRDAIDNLHSGACFLPEESYTDYYGNKVPSRNDITRWSTGTLELSQKFWSNHEFEPEGEIHEESLKAKTADFIHPSETKKIKTWVMQDEYLLGWLKSEVRDINNVREVNYFIRNHAVDLASAINHRLQPTYAMKKAADGSSIFTVEPEEQFHCPYCGVRIDEDVNGQFMGQPGVVYTAHCPGCHKDMSVELDTETTKGYRGEDTISDINEEKVMIDIEGSLKALAAAPEFQMEMELGEIIPAPYTGKTELWIEDLLKQQSALPFPLPSSFSVVIPKGNYTHHAEEKPVEGFPDGNGPHEWYFTGLFQIFDLATSSVIGEGDFSVDGLWDSEDGDVIGNSLKVLNLRPGEEGEGNDPNNEPSLSSWARD